MAEANLLKTTQPLPKVRRQNSESAKRRLLTFGEKLLLVLVGELLRWLARG